jgi:integrase
MSSRTPKYRRHKPTGQAVVTLNGHDHYLGKHGSPASKAEYDRLIAEWLAHSRQLPRRGNSLDGLSVNELLLAYWKQAEEYYRHPDGRPTSEAGNIRLALRLVRELYGHTPAAAFDSMALETVRQVMIDRGLCRGRVNKDVARIKRAFKWAAFKKLVPLAVHQCLQTVEGLRRGRSQARETEPVRPVAEADVEATLPFLRPPVAAMVRLQLLTGMRPGEVVVMRAIDLDTRGQVWLYRPGSDQGPHGAHKTAWRGQKRVAFIGPRAQEVLRPFLKTDLYAYLFSPADAMEGFRQEQRQKRKSKVPPSQQNRRKAKPRRRPGIRYTVSAYDRAIESACDRAFPPPAPLARREDETAKAWGARLTAEQKEELRQWRQAHRWHPNQLRHTKATEIRREAGLDAARAILGHRSPQVTEVYAELDEAKAAEVMARLG